MPINYDEKRGGLITVMTLGGKLSMAEDKRQLLGALRGEEQEHPKKNWPCLVIHERTAMQQNSTMKRLKGLTNGSQWG